MSAALPTVPLREAAQPVSRSIVPSPGETYRQLGVSLWGKGAYEREPVDGGLTKYQQLFRAERGDIVVNKIWARNGSVAVVDDSLAGCHGSNEFPMFAPIEGRLDPRWMHWVTKTKDFWAQCDQKSQGTSGQNRIKPERFLEVEIPLPPLDEQRRIVARIEELAAKLEEARNLRALSKAASGAFIASTHAALAAGHDEPLSAFLILDEDAVPIDVGNAYPQAGVRGFGGGLFGKQPVFGGETTYRAFNRLYPGALVLSQVKGWEGAIAMTPLELEGYFVSPEYRTFRWRPERVLPEYMAALVPTEFFWGRLKEVTRGVGARRERTRPERFLELPFSMPSLEDQHRLLQMYSSIKAIQDLQDETAAELDAMLPAILDKAFKGEL
jgi:type I restriction enzyme S subunit